MTLYTVVCQDAVGHETTVTVSADTDEHACAAALKTLNSWLAVRALPATVELPKPQTTKVVPPAPVAEVAEEEPLQIGRIVQKGTVIDWIESRAGGGVGSVGAALIEARERRAA